MSSRAPAGDSQHLGAALIPLVNRLQDITASLGVDTGVDLPQVAVVGRPYILRDSCVAVGF